MDNLAQGVGNSSQDIQKNRINIILHNIDKEEMKKKRNIKIPNLKEKAKYLFHLPRFGVLLLLMMTLL